MIFFQSFDINTTLMKRDTCDQHKYIYYSSQTLYDVIYSGAVMYFISQEERKGVGAGVLQKVGPMVGEARK